MPVILNHMFNGTMVFFMSLEYIYLSIFALEGLE